MRAIYQTVFIMSKLVQIRPYISAIGKAPFNLLEIFHMDVIQLVDDWTCPRDQGNKYVNNFNIVKLGIG